MKEMYMLRKGLLLFCCFALVGGTLSAATSFTWTGTGGNNYWTTPGNWAPTSGVGGPQYNDTAIINNGGTVSFDSTLGEYVSDTGGFHFPHTNRYHYLVESNIILSNGTITAPAGGVLEIGTVTDSRDVTQTGGAVNVDYLVLATDRTIVPQTTPRTPVRTRYAMSGGSITTSTLIVGDGQHATPLIYPNYAVAATLDVTGNSVITVNGTAGTDGGLIVGVNAERAELNISGNGKLNSNLNMYVGYMTVAPEEGLGSATAASMTISGNASVNTSKDLIIGYYGENRPEWLDNVNKNYYTKSEVNVYGGELKVAGALKGYNSNSALNIMGSKGTVEVGSIVRSMGQNGPGGFPFNWNSTLLNINFTLDKDGVSTLTVLGNANLSDPITINIPGFVALQNNYFEIINAGSITGFTGSASDIINNTPYDIFNMGPSTLLSGRESFSLYLDPNSIPEWDMTGIYNVFSPELQITGGLRVHDEVEHRSNTGIIVTFATDAADGVAVTPALLDYLNNSMLDTGVTFTKINDTSVLMTGAYLNGDNMSWFGWDLRGFTNDDDCCCEGPRLVSFRVDGRDTRDEDPNAVPEPATWAMMLLGGVALWGLRRRVL